MTFHHYRMLTRELRCSAARLCRVSPWEETLGAVPDEGLLRAGRQVRENGAQPEISNPAPSRRISKAPWPGR